MGKLVIESVFGFVRTTLAGLTPFAAAYAVGRAFVLAVPFKLAVLLHEHLDADASKGECHN